MEAIVTNKLYKFCSNLLKIIKYYKALLLICRNLKKTLDFSPVCDYNVKQEILWEEFKWIKKNLH